MYVYNIDSGFPMFFHPNTLNPHFSPCLTAPCDPRGRGRRGRGLKPHGAALLGSTGRPRGTPCVTWPCDDWGMVQMTSFDPY